MLLLSMTIHYAYILGILTNKSSLTFLMTVESVT